MVFKSFLWYKYYLSWTKVSLRIRVDLDIFGLLALKGTTKVLVALHSLGKMRYSALVKTVGHSTTTTRALNRMESLGLVRREVLAEKYRPVVYSLTQKGKKLAQIVLELQDFEKELL